MKGLVIGIAVSAVAFAILVNVLPDTWIEFRGEPVQLALLSIGVGVVNALIKPVIKVLSFPINMMTLGLFGLVINAALLLGVAWVAQGFANIDLTVGGWPAGDFTVDTIVGAVIASVALGLITAAIGLIVHD